MAYFHLVLIMILNDNRLTKNVNMTWMIKKTFFPKTLAILGKWANIVLQANCYIETTKQILVLLMMGLTLLLPKTNI